MKDKDINANAVKYLDYDNDPHGTRLYRHIKADGTTKTSTMIDPSTNARTSNITRIIECMEEAWTPVYNRHAADAPDFKVFCDNYQEHFHSFTQSPQDTPTGALLYAQAQRAKPRVCAGRDGITPAELKFLPMQAWMQRQRALDLAIEVNKFPT